MALTTKQTTIDDYKSKLGYGARSNLFLTELTLPAFLVNPVLEEEVRIMAEKFTMPPARAINEIAVPIAGETFKLAGDKTAEIDVTLSFKNTEDYRLRNMFELWIDTIQQDITGLRTSPQNYKATQFFVSQLNHRNEVTKKVELIGAWPKTINQIDFDLTTDGTILLTDVTFGIDGHNTVLL
jgi:hypothetical protein